MDVPLPPQATVVKDGNMVHNMADLLFQEKPPKDLNRKCDFPILNWGQQTQVYASTLNLLTVL